MGVQASVCEVLINVGACEVLKEVEEVAEGEGEVCTPTLSTFQQVCLLLHAICTHVTSF